MRNLKISCTRFKKVFRKIRFDLAEDFLQKFGGVICVVKLSVDSLVDD